MLFRSRDLDVELVTLRLVAAGRTDQPEAHHQDDPNAAAPAPRYREVWFQATGRLDCAVWKRSTLKPGFELTGPALIEEEASTTVITPGDRARIDDLGNIIIELA